MSFAQNYGIWTLTDSLNAPRNHAASLELANGNILVAGGIDSINIKDAEIFDYKLEKWNRINSMVVGRSYFKLVRLGSGNVLAIGGGYHSNQCEIYDTISKKWSLTDSSKIGISGGGTATLLDDGNVLVIGGYYINSGLNSCEIYNINTSKWNIMDSLKIDRHGHTATKLLDGRVLVVGGFSNTKLELSDCEIFNPQTSKWTEAAPLNIPRYNHTAILLKDGNVLVTGGISFSNNQTTWLNSCELYDPIKNTWIIVDSLLAPRANHFAIMLKSGLLLLAGGDFNSDTWELYNPDNFSNVYLGNYPGRQDGPLINLLPDGKVLSAGGMTWTDDSTPYVYPARLSYLFTPDTVDGISEPKNNIINNFKLYQNYPNPFNPLTTIKYQIPKESNVKIKVYDVLGKEVSTLLNEKQKAGEHVVEWNAKDFASGIYFYRIRAGEFVSTKKMLLIK